jgi:hypothetical protein
LSPVWVNGNNGRAFGEELLAKHLQERAPVAASKHGRLPDEGIDNHSSIGEMRQMRLRLGIYGIGLQVGEGATFMLHDPLPHQGFIEVFSDQIDLLLGITPTSAAPPVFQASEQPSAGRHRSTAGNDRLTWSWYLISNCEFRRADPAR